MPPGGEERDDEDFDRGIISAPSISITPVRASVVEGGEVRFVLTADYAPSFTLFVNVTVSEDGSFLNEPIPSVITISAGTLTSDLILETDNDSTDEDSGWVHATIEFGNNYLVGSPGSASMWVWDNDLPPVIPELTIEAYSSPVEEGDNVIFRVKADHAPSTLLHINVDADEIGSFLSGTPVPEITMDAGSRETLYIIATSDDDVYEPDGSVTAYLDPGTGYTVDGDNDFDTVEVQDNDDPPSISIHPPTGVITEGDSIYFRVEADFAPSFRLPVNVSATEMGSFLDNPVDEIAFGPGDTTIYYIVATIDDSVDEPHGVVTGSILSATGTRYTVGSPYQASVAVWDDDLSPPPAPAGLRVTFATSDSVSLTWDDLAGTEGYQLRHRESGTFAWEETGEFSRETYTIGSLDSGITYEFQVRARGDGSDYEYALGEWSGSVNASTPTVSFTGLPSQLGVGKSDGFTVVASSLNRNRYYALLVLADQETGLRDGPEDPDEDEPLAFGTRSTDCDMKMDGTDIDGGLGSYTWNLTLVGCEAGTGDLTASLLDRTGYSNPSDYRAVDRQSDTVTVVGNEPPTITGPDDIDYAENGIGHVSEYSADDPENDAIRWSLEGDDRNDFSLINGTLDFDSTPDYEAPVDTDGDNVYEITVVATDDGSPNESSRLEVEVTVTNVNEPPSFEGQTIDDVLVEEGEVISPPVTLPEASGDKTPITYSLYLTDDEQEELPDGLEFNASNRQLSGSPDEAGPHELTYTATDANGDEVSLEFSVRANRMPGFEQTSFDRVKFYIQAATKYELPEAMDGDGPTRYEVSGHSSELTYNESEHTLEGTPAITKLAHNILVKAIDTADGDEASVTIPAIVVNQLAPAVITDIVPRGSRALDVTWSASASGNYDTLYHLYYRNPDGSSGDVRLLEDLAHRPVDGEMTGRIWYDSRLKGARLDLHDYANLWVIAEDSTMARPDSDSEGAVILQDSIITRVDGNNKGKTEIGTATVMWTPPADAVEYQIRWRMLRDHDSVKHGLSAHTTFAWMPSDSSIPETYDDSITKNDREATSYPIDSIALDNLYSVQVNYLRSNSNGEKEWVFAARDHFVYPSGDVVRGGDRIGSFPLSQMRPDRKFEYVVCANTFSAVEDEQNLYRDFIDNAFKQWQDATGILTVEPKKDDNGMLVGCTDYDDIVATIHDKLRDYIQMHTGGGAVPSLFNITQKARELAGNLDEQGLQSRRGDDRDLNEVMVVQNARAYNTAELVERHFAQMAKVAFTGICSADAIGCATPSISTTGGWTSDIKLIPGDELPLTNVIPDLNDIKMGYCGSGKTNRLYGTLIHEAGHALGIIGGSQGEYPQQPGHPYLYMPETVMSYADGLRYTCEPHPLDIMAIHALYQTK